MPTEEFKICQQKKAVSILQKERLTKDVRYQEFREIALGKRSGQAIYQGLFLFLCSAAGRAAFCVAAEYRYFLTEKRRNLLMTGGLL